MNYKTGLIAALVLSPILLISGHAVAEGKAGFKGCHHERGAGFTGGMLDRPERMEKMFNKLDLEPEQQDNIKAIMESKRDAQQQLKAQLSVSREEMHKLRGEGYDQEKFASLARQHADAMTEMMVLNYELRHSIKNELSAEQQQRLQERMEQRKEKMKERRQQRMDRPQSES